MNIGIDIRPLMTKNKTGVGEYTFELLNAIFKLDTTNQYFLFSNAAKNLQRFLPRWQQPNVHFISTAYPNKILNFALAFGLININRLLPQPIDIWYSPNINFLSLDKNIKHILTIHDLSFELFPEFYTHKQVWWHKIIGSKKQAQTADKIIVPSENTKRDLVNYYRIEENKIQVIYPGVAEKFTTNSDELSRSKNLVIKKYNLPENFILFLGAIEPRKNIIGLIEAYEKLPTVLTEKYSLIIAGAAGWKNKIIYKKANFSKLRNKIKFLGYVADSDKPALYSLSNLFVFPSFYEGFGFPLIEAMHMSVPTIAANRSSLPEIAGQASYFINPNNICEITEAIKKILTDSNLKNLYIKRGLDLASKYTWWESAKEHLAIINR